jgi:hypothetical protein
MATHTDHSVLVLGGSGVVGSRAVRALRRLQPRLPITISGRDLDKANALAQEIGGADTLKVDLERSDLGLPREQAFSIIVALLKDHSLNSLKYAQALGVPYVAFSDFVFDIAPEVALYVHRPTRAPILILGHFLGGTVCLSTLHFAREFRSVHAIEISALFDADDMGGPVGQADFARLAQGAPQALILRDGKWVWAEGEDARRRFVDVDGIERQGQAYPLLDVVSLAATTGARSIRVDGAVRDATSPRGAGGHPSHQVIIEIVGEQLNGTTRRVRHELTDAEVHSGMSARGAALAVERLLGLAGGPPVAPGLYHPENLLDPAYVVARMREFGTQIARRDTRDR